MGKWKELAEPPCKTGSQCIGGKCLQCVQPQREWQGLTEEEIMGACSAVWASHPIEVGRVVEAKLKEKNNG